MKSTLQTLLTQALELPSSDRADFAERLWDSVEREREATVWASHEIEQAWIEEAERRADAVERGEMKLVPGEPILKALEEGRTP